VTEARYTYAVRPGECWLAQFDGRACEGRMDPAHLVSKQALKRAKCEVDLWDETVWVPACRFHHGQFDNHRLTVPREALPASLIALCERIELDWWIDRRYPQAAAA
jgi:hypothetical protein